MSHEHGASTPADLQQTLDAIVRDLAEIRDAIIGARKSHYTVVEIARLVGRSEYTVRRWIAEGRIQATRVAGTGPKGRLLIAREQIAVLIESGVGSHAPEHMAIGQS